MGAPIVLPRISDMSRRILRVYRSATPAQIENGLNWYPAARDIAGDIAHDARIPLETAAGILAALSPQTSWGQNVDWARELAAGSPISRGLPMSQARGMAILAQDREPLEILGGIKVRAFYACIVTAGATDAVCVDRHAYDIATGLRGSHVSLSTKRSEHCARAYQCAAARLRSTGESPGITAAQLQAVTWVTWRARYWQAGAWDGYREDPNRAPVAIESEVF
jgi:hypothetical protein